jgi:hypothetical protein
MFQAPKGYMMVGLGLHSETDCLVYHAWKCTSLCVIVQDVRFHKTRAKDAKQKQMVPKVT